MVKILLADDHNILLEGLSMLLDGIESLEVVGTVNNGQQAIQFLQNNEVDLVLADLNMPIMSGLGLVNAIRKNQHPVRIILLSMVDDPAKIRDAIQLGADGYLLKNSNRREVQFAIKSVMQGENYFSPAITRRLAEIPSVSSVSGKVEAKEIQMLTRREREILLMIIQDQSNQEIADTLIISPLTVETHRRNLYRKVDVSSALGLMHYALRTGMI